MRRFLLLLIAGGLAGCASDPDRVGDARPNVLVIVADDLGYLDLSLFGSEIRTPHIDRLARSGMLLTNFLVAPACSPTRAMLLSGATAHGAGLGTMSGEHDDNQKGKPGYEGYLSPRVTTIATRLKNAGYATCMAGKWHLGMKSEQGPKARGFQRSFALLPGGASHFDDAFRLVEHPEAAPYRRDGVAVSVPKGFFSTDAFTDALIEQTGEAAADGKPFFAYAAYPAPHWPLHAPDRWIDRYRGVYDDGWDDLFQRRLGQGRSHGVVPPGSSAPSPYRFGTRWADRTPAQRRHDARTMEVYAAMVEHLDHGIGRLLAALEARGQLENTLVLFFTDNGPEGNPVGRLAGIDEWVARAFDNRPENIGRRGSYTWLRPEWARASVAPFRLFKSFPTQGGVRVPAIASWPGRIPAGARSDAVATVRDIAPTVLGLSGVTETPGPFWEHLTGATDRVHDQQHTVVWELFGRRAVQRGPWKALWLWPPYGAGSWRLHDLRTDPAERHDVAADHPRRLNELLNAWKEYVEEHGVVLPTRDTGYALEPAAQPR